MKAILFAVAGVLTGALCGLLAGAAFLPVVGALSHQSYDGMGVMVYGLVGSVIGSVVGLIVGIAKAISGDSDEGKKD